MSGPGSEPATGPWALAGEPASLGDTSGLVTLVAGQSFCVSGRGGDIHAGTPQGIYFADMRVLSACRLRVDHEGLEPLAVEPRGGWSATFVARPRPGPRPRPGLLLLRRRSLGLVCREEIEIRNHGDVDERLTVRLDLASDFADLFAVKENRVRLRGERSVRVEERALVSAVRNRGIHRQVRIAFSGGTEIDVDAAGATWSVAVPARGRTVLVWDVSAAIGDRWVVPVTVGEAGRTEAAARVAEWVAEAPVLLTDHGVLAHTVARSVDDLGSLRLFDPADDTALPVVAAGAPWFMALFGRDALITSLLALPVDPTLGLGVLRALARLQGTRTVPQTEEEPGRIMHEARHDDANALALDAGEVYYGTADATPLFVVVLGGLVRWGLGDDDLDELLPHADRALAWIRDHGDRDGDGYVEYLRATPSGLANQGWKDSWDGVRYHDGRVAHAPIALCEVQGYVYAAYLARAGIAERLGDHTTARHYTALARRLRTAFDRDFWCPEHGWYAMGLDAEKRRIDALASNMGHALWSGIVPQRRRRAVVERLFSPAVWSGFGVRTLAADEPAFDPLSYHCGSVWPHDNALCALGLAAHGFTTHLDRLVTGLLDAARAFDGRLPELFCGLDRSDVSTPVAFPTSCSPQAWAAATPFALVQALLGLQVDLPGRCVRLAPHLPVGLDTLSWSGVRIGDARVDITVERSRPPRIEGLPDDIVVTVAGQASRPGSAAGPHADARSGARASR